MFNLNNGRNANSEAQRFIDALDRVKSMAPVVGMVQAGKHADANARMKAMDKQEMMQAITDVGSLLSDIQGLALILPMQLLTNILDKKKGGGLFE